MRSTILIKVFILFSNVLFTVDSTLEVSPLNLVLEVGAFANVTFTVKGKSGCGLECNLEKSKDSETDENGNLLDKDFYEDEEDDVNPENEIIHIPDQLIQALSTTSWLVSYKIPSYKYQLSYLRCSYCSSKNYSVITIGEQPTSAQNFSCRMNGLSGMQCEYQEVRSGVMKPSLIEKMSFHLFQNSTLIKEISISSNQFQIANLNLPNLCHMINLSDSIGAQIMIHNPLNTSKSDFFNFTLLELAVPFRIVDLSLKVKDADLLTFSLTLGTSNLTYDLQLRFQCHDNDHVFDLKMMPGFEDMNTQSFCHHHIPQAGAKSPTTFHLDQRNLPAYTECTVSARVRFANSMFYAPWSNALQVTTNERR